MSKLTESFEIIFGQVEQTIVQRDGLVIELKHCVNSPCVTISVLKENYNNIIPPDAFICAKIIRPYDTVEYLRANEIFVGNNALALYNDINETTSFLIQKAN